MTIIIQRNYYLDYKKKISDYIKHYTVFNKEKSDSELGRERSYEDMDYWTK